MATRKTNSNKKSNKKNERREVENRYPENKIVDFGIENVRVFEDSFGNDGAYFDLDLGFMIVKGMVYRQNKDGEGYITFPSEKASNGNYYKTGYINDDCLSDAIRDSVEDVLYK